MEQEYSVGDGWVVHTPDPSKYHDPSNLSLDTQFGRPMSTALPARFGLKGTVLPRATVLGGTRNKQAMKVDKIQIDPHIQGEEPIRLDLSELTDLSVQEAFENADGDDLRMIAFNTFKKLAGKEQFRHEEISSAILGSESHDLPNAYVLDRAKSPLSVTRKANFSKQFSKEEDMPRIKNEVKSNVQQSEESLANVVGPPTCKVTFELEQFGELTTAYHFVATADNDVALVLVYNTDYTAGTKFYPSVNSEAALYLDVHDSPYVYKVRSVGIKFTVGQLEYNVLLIEEKATKE